MINEELIFAFSTIFSTIDHMLRLWHINNNILSNCKKFFDTKKEWDDFFKKWKSIINASMKVKFWELWNQFRDKYHEECEKYLTFIYIINHRQRFVKCYTNKLLHFETTMTLREEDAHVVLKHQLKTSTENLKVVINEINLLLINQYHNHLIVFAETKSRFLIDFRKSVF